MILDCAREGKKSLHAGRDALVTAAAADAARRHGIAIVIGTPDAGPASAPGPAPAADRSVRTVALGSDHGGFALKEVLRPYIESLGYAVIDVGTTSAEACDYPDFAFAVARMVHAGTACRGIMIDAVGLASAIVANKVCCIRATCCTDEFSARSSREHNDANVLTLGGRVLGTELAKAIVRVWLETPFSGGRHQKRIEKIGEIEKLRLSKKPNE
ncbi:MAG TPA: ribose 5-phosphate isomerase B [Bacteroidota bacterium]|nr:ribose 5-phosphate isomerase B [Bacteroidota bacterium]